MLAKIENTDDKLINLEGSLMTAEYNEGKRRYDIDLGFGQSIDLKLKQAS